MTTIAFSGTRKGMTALQTAKVLELLEDFPANSVFLHGMCVGADAEFHRLVRRVSLQRMAGFRIEMYPCDLRGWQAKGLVADYKHPEMKSLVRNRKMVDLASVLIATPFSNEEIMRSGTWSTIRYAKHTGKQLYLVNPDGRVTK